jgi:hypothetical protein
MKNRSHGADNVLDQGDETFTVSDEALEKAAGGIAWPPMLTAVATIWVRETVAVTCCDHSSTIHNE